MSEGTKIYPQVIPDIEDWPIYKLHDDRRRFVQEIDEFTLNRLLRKSTAELSDLIAKTIFMERIRIKEEPWKVDPPNERQFWKRISKKLVSTSLDRSEMEAAKSNEEILRLIIHRYSEEIVGTFGIKTFLFARRFLTFFFTRLLNAISAKNISGLWGVRKQLADHMIVRGQVEQVRELMKKGTVVLAPTHSSNLDSILIGYALDMFVGLPSFSYGAGLNLYNTGYTAYFMNRLGAYRVDRRKKNAIYLETLKAMSNLSIQRGTNSLFFPGGTRSRSGALENKLKLGLLGSVMEAQRSLYQNGKDVKIFIVPLVLCYHCVLEGQFLIEQQLRQMGKERYLKAHEERYSFWNVLKFTWLFFSKGNEVTLSFGQPMDVLGNPVDENGNSCDKYGNPIDVKSYFITNNKITEDLQRESEYTKMLADKIVHRYYKDNVVLSSHITAFLAFELLKRQNLKLDLYGVLRLPEEEYIFPMDQLEDAMQQLLVVLFEMENNGDIQLSERLRLPIEDIIKDGVMRLGTYHVDKPLRFNKKGQLVSDSFNLLYFYHNRLDNYDFHKKINWKKVPDMEVLEEGIV